MRQAAPTLTSAVVVPDHELMRPIGRGSYGEVWLARNAFGEWRAVKIIRRDQFDRDRPVERELEGIRRFEPISREHENQVHVLHVGRFAEGFFYVMELADAIGTDDGTVEAGKQSAPGKATQPLTFSPVDYVPRTLRSEVQRRGRLPIDECLELALKLTDALAHLHGHRLVHRDVKPSNIIFVRGQPKLADIGLVAAEDASISCVGTEGFLPPEGPGKPQADLYALGKVLYEISTGRDRHDFPELPTLLREDPQRRALEEFNEIILKACDPEMRWRYQTAQEMRADLQLLRAGKSLQRKRSRARLLARARKAGLGTALGLLAIVGGSYVARQAPSTGNSLPRQLRIDADLKFPEGRNALRFDISSDGQRIVFGTVEGRVVVWDARTALSRAVALPGTNQWWLFPRWAPDNRHFIIETGPRYDGTNNPPHRMCSLFLVDAETGSATQIGPRLSQQERPVDLCWFPDGTTLACVDSAQRLSTLSLRGERQRWPEFRIPGMGEAAPRLLLGGYSHDGRWLLLSVNIGSRGQDRNRDIWLIPHLGGQPLPLVQRPGMDTDPTWGADGRWVYFVSAGGRALINTWGLWRVRVDLGTGQAKGPSEAVFNKPGQKMARPRFVADGQRLIYAMEEPNTRIWSADSAQLETATKVARGQEPVLSPDGTTIYFVGETPEQQGLFAIDRRGEGSPRKISELIPLGVNHGRYLGLTRPGLSVSPDGESIAMCSLRGNEPAVVIVPTGGGEPQWVETGTSWEGIIPVWSPDGHWLAYAQDTILCRVSRDGNVRETLAALHRWEPWTVRWSGDGTHLAALGYETPEDWEKDTRQAAWIVSVADKKLRKITPDHETNYKEGLEWHPDGQRLTYFYYDGPKGNGAKIKWAYPDGRPTEEMIDQTDYWDYLGLWAPDGRRYFFTSYQTMGEELFAYDLETKSIKHGGRGGSVPAWSQDGRAAVWFEGQTLRYFEMIESFSR